MFTYFFTYQWDLPPNVGFTIGSKQHIGMLAVLFLVLTFLLVRVLNTPHVSKVLTSTGIVLVTLEILRLFYLAVISRLTVYDLPLHLCSLAGFLCLVHALSAQDGLGQILYALCLPATLAALLFPDWGDYPIISFLSLQSFVFHALIAFYILLALKTVKIVPDLKCVWKVFVFLFLIVPCIYLFNRHFGTNYFFVNQPSFGSPLASLYMHLGYSGYLFFYALLTSIVIFFMELLYIIVKNRRLIKWNH